MSDKLKGRNIVVGVTGCIAAYKACELVSRLAQAGARVRGIMTANAREFVRPLTFRVLSGEPVFSGIFDAPREFDPSHISLADWAEAIVIAPATANLIGKIAAGIADDLLTCTVMAAGCPVLIAPAMNVNMYRNAIVQENIGRLKERGYGFVGPGEGRLACGYDGIGRLSPTSEIIKAAEGLL